MSITYENSRVNFDIIARKYKAYVELYRMCNNGSVEGLTPFDDFYWRMTYYSEYADPDMIGSQGY